MLAKFKCLKCSFSYEDKPGPTQCPQCSHLYVKWVNYEEWYGQSETKKYNNKNQAEVGEAWSGTHNKVPARSPDGVGNK